MSKYMRPLHNNETVESFVENILDINPSISSKTFNKNVAKILSAEMQLRGIESKSTLYSTEFRTGKYRNDADRVALRKRIFTDLSTKPRLKDEEKIALGKGGALPISGPFQERCAYYIIGLPASGKSKVANFIAEKEHAIILDSDYAMRKFPEFKMDCGASLTHRESVMVIFGDSHCPNEDSLLSFAVNGGYNIIIPKIGNEYNDVLLLCNELRNFDYKIHLVLVRLDRVMATKRAFSRFCKTGRYVALPLIFDGYANDPTIVYYDLRHFSKDVFESFTMLSTDVPIGTRPKLLEYTSKSPVIAYYSEQESLAE